MGKSKFEGNLEAVGAIEEAGGFLSKAKGDPDLWKKRQTAPGRGETKRAKKKESILNDRGFSQ